MILVKTVLGAWGKTMAPSIIRSSRIMSFMENSIIAVFFEKEHVAKAWAWRVSGKTTEVLANPSD